MWAADEKIGDAAELLHRQFLKHILNVRDSTANVIILAGLGVFLCGFIGGNKCCDVIIASPSFLMMNVSSSVPLLKACMIQHTFFGAIKSHLAPGSIFRFEH